MHLPGTDFLHRLPAAVLLLSHADPSFACQHREIFCLMLTLCRLTAIQHICLTGVCLLQQMVPPSSLLPPQHVLCICMASASAHLCLCRVTVKKNPEDTLKDLKS